jgi:hypothetical protein
MKIGIREPSATRRSREDGCVRLVADKLGLNESRTLPILLPLRQIGRYLAKHRPKDDGTEGHAVLLDFFLQVLKNERIEVRPEWTRSLWGKDAFDPEFGYPYDPKDLERERLDAAHDLPDCLTEWRHPVWQ